MIDIYDTLGRKLLFTLDAEQAHALSIRALQLGFFPRFDHSRDPRLAVDIAGLSFPNPLGMAAGFDKNGQVPDALLSMGFGHAELGTVTPKPQPGNPKPRIFRLPEDGGVINRLGFNSGGHDSVADTLRQRKAAKTGKTGKSDRANRGIIGVNIGANKTSEDFAADYVTGIHAFADMATYYTVNISSPNTPGLRALQGGDPLNDLLQRVDVARGEETERTGRRIPVFLKIAPDLDETELDAIADALQRSDFDALIVSNTTLARNNLVSNNSAEAGGLSGAPLFQRSTIVLAKMRQRLAANFPLIGVGGISDTETALSKIEAGASLIQMYTGLIYGGPGLPGKIITGLGKTLDAENADSIQTFVGRKAKQWADLSLS